VHDDHAWKIAIEEAATNKATFFDMSAAEVATNKDTVLEAELFCPASAENGVSCR